MPLKTPTVIVDLFDISGGWVPDASQYSLQPNELVEAENVEYDIRGGFRVRAGFDNLQNTGVTFAHLGVYTKDDGSHWLIAVDTSGNIWADSNLSLVDTTKNLAAYTIGSDPDREYDVGITQLRGYAYVASRRGNTWRFDGTTWLEITDSTLNGAGDDTTPEFPQAKTTLALHSRIFAGNIRHDGADWPSRLRWSTLAFGENQEGGNRWEANSFVDVNERDGSEIQAIVGFQSMMVIFKDNSLYVMAGDDEDNFNITPIDSTIGTTMSGSIASDQSVLFFLDQSSGVYMFDGVTAQRIDEQVNAHIMAIVKGFAGDKLFAKGWIEDHKYFLVIGQMDGNRETFVFDMRQAAWSHWNMEWLDLISYLDVTYMAGQDGISSFRDRTFLDDDATDVDWSVKWAWIPAAEGQDMRQYRIRRVDVHSQWVTGGAATYEFDMFADNDDTTPVWTNDPAGDEAQERFPGYDGLIFRVMFHCHGTNTSAVQTDRRISGLSIKLSGRESKGSFAAGLIAATTLPSSRSHWGGVSQGLVAATHAEDTTTIAVPAGGQLGDVLVMISADQVDTFWNNISGWTTLNNDSDAFAGEAMSFAQYSRVWTQSEPASYEVSKTADHIVMLLLRGMDITNYTQTKTQHFGGTSGGSSTKHPTNINNNDGDTLIAFLYCTDDGLTVYEMQTPTGWTELLDPGPEITDTSPARLYYQTSDGTQFNETYDLTTSESFLAVVLHIRVWVDGSN